MIKSLLFYVHTGQKAHRCNTPTQLQSLQTNDSSGLSSSECGQSHLMEICTFLFGNKICNYNIELAELQHHTSPASRIQVLLTHTEPEEISVELQREKASSPFRCVRRTAGNFSAIDEISCRAMSKKAISVERGTRGKWEKSRA